MKSKNLLKITIHWEKVVLWYLVKGRTLALDCKGWTFSTWFYEKWNNWRNVLIPRQGCSWSTARWNKKSCIKCGEK